jgi:hypothetical protein
MAEAIHRQAIVDTARSYVGTKVVHHGRSRRDGLDCIGLVIVTARDLGFTKYRDQRYEPTADGTELQAVFDRYLQRRPRPLVFEPGDVVHFRLGEQYQHVGIVGILYDFSQTGSLTLIHSHNAARVRRLPDRGYTVEHRLNAAWRNRARAVWSFPGALPWQHSD